MTALYLFLALAVVGLLLALLPSVLRRDRRLDEVERFHLARQMTTQWSRGGVPQPVFADEAADASGAPDHVDAGDQQR